MDIQVPVLAKCVKMVMIGRTKDLIGRCQFGPKLNTGGSQRLSKSSDVFRNVAKALNLLLISRNMFVN